MEGRVSSDQDLKLGDTLRYYQRDSNAAKALLVRRLRCLAAYETANRSLERARAKNKDVHAVSDIIVASVFICCQSLPEFSNIIDGKTERDSYSPPLHCVYMFKMHLFCSRFTTHS